MVRPKSKTGINNRNASYEEESVSYTPPRILMDSIRSPDKVLILLMDS
jgi:hypothetical protein